MSKVKQNTVWVLTAEANDYDQHGEYFIAVWGSKPDHTQLIDATVGNQPASSVPELLKFILHLEAGGGRRDSEDFWYHLKEISV